MADEAVPLVCPACRRVEAGKLFVRGLTRVGALLACACGRRYPIIDGIPIVLRDLDGWAASEGADALRDPRLAPEVVELLAVDAASRRNRRLLDVYGAIGVSSPFDEWLADLVYNTPGSLLEVGAGIGHATPVRLDLNLALLRAGGPSPALVESSGWVALGCGAAIVADAADPPFAGGSFSTVIVANVLDSCGDPALVLAQADALVAPDGRLVVACAFAFEEAITPRAAWFDEAALDDALTGRRPFGGYALVCRADGPALELEWRLRVSPRTFHVHTVRVRTARHPG